MNRLQVDRGQVLWDSGPCPHPPLLLCDDPRGRLVRTTICVKAILILFPTRFETKPLLVDSLYYLDRILTVVFFLETCLKLLAMGIVAYFGNAWYLFLNCCWWLSCSFECINLISFLYLIDIWMVVSILFKIFYIWMFRCWLDFVIVGVSLINFAASLLGHHPS